MGDRHQLLWMPFISIRTNLRTRPMMLFFCKFAKKVQWDSRVLIRKSPIYICNYLEIKGTISKNSNAVSSESVEKSRLYEIGGRMNKKIRKGNYHQLLNL